MDTRPVTRCSGPWGAGLRDAAGGAGFVARYGGEEFTVIVVNPTLGSLRMLAETVRKTIAERSVVHDGITLSVTVSVGAAMIRPADDTDDAATRLVEKADRLLYRAKHNGRNRVELMG